MPRVPIERWRLTEDPLGDFTRTEMTLLGDAGSGPAVIVRGCVTQRLIDEREQPTRAAVDEILAFFGERLS